MHMQKLEDSFRGTQHIQKVLERKDMEDDSESDEKIVSIGQAQVKDYHIDKNNNTSKNAAPDAEQNDLQIDVMKSADSMRPLVTQDSYIYGDDEIRQVVSQVRMIERDCIEDRNRNQYKFEIERTDSLEFTRHSGMVDDENVSRVQASSFSGSKSRHRNSERDLDKTHNEVQSQCSQSSQNSAGQRLERDTSRLRNKIKMRSAVEYINSERNQNELSDNAIRQTEMNQVKNTHSREELLSQRRIYWQNSDKNRKNQYIQPHIILQTERSRTSEPLVFQYRSNSQKVVRSADTTSFEDPPEQDLNERSQTSSNYKIQCADGNQKQDESQTAFRGFVSGSQCTNYGYDMIPSELPLANSQVFEEGDMPIPAKFNRTRHTKRGEVGISELHKKSKKASKQLNVAPSNIVDKKDIYQKQPNMQRSRVKDHVNRFIRQSQELGATLGINQNQRSSNQHSQPPKTQRIPFCKSVKQSFRMEPKSLISSHKNKTEKYHVSPTKQSQLDYLSAINHVVQTNQPTSMLSNENDLPFIYDEMILVNSANLTAKTHQKSTITSAGIPSHSYKDSHFHREAVMSKQQHQKFYMNLGNGSNATLTYHNQMAGVGNQDRMYYEDLLGSQIMLDQTGSDEDYKYLVAHQHQLHNKDFKSLHGQIEIQPTSELTSESDNFGQYTGNQGILRDAPIRVFNEELNLKKFNSGQNSEEIIDRNDHESEITAKPQQFQWNPRPSGGPDLEKIMTSAVGPNKTSKNLQVLDQSACEYDCADEAMDGTESICKDNNILAQNLTRVQQMYIQKPTIQRNTTPDPRPSQLDVHPVQDQVKINKATQRLERLKSSSQHDCNNRDAPGMLQPTPKTFQTLKNLLFSVRPQPPKDIDTKWECKTERQHKKQLSIPDNNQVTVKSFFQAPTQSHSQSVLKQSAQAKIKKAFSFVQNAQVKKHHYQRHIGPLIDSSQHNQSTPTGANYLLQQKSPPANLKFRSCHTEQEYSNEKSQKHSSAYKIRTEASPISEYQISKQVQQWQNHALSSEKCKKYPLATGVSQPQNTSRNLNKNYMQSGSNPYNTPLPMSTIMESLISIENQQQYNSNQSTKICCLNQQTQAQQQLQTSQQHVQLTADHQYQFQYSAESGTSDFQQPVTSKKQLDNNLYSNEHHQFQFQANRADVSEKRVFSSVATQKQQQYGGMVDANWMMGHERDRPLQNNYNATAKREYQKQANCTVLSLNSSRQPTTKNQLESQFLQRSQSNDGASSTATCKPEAFALATNNATSDWSQKNKVLTRQFKFDQRQSEILFNKNNNTFRNMASPPQIRKIKPETMTPQRASCEKNLLNSKHCNLGSGAIISPVTDMRGHAQDDLDYEVGRGMTDSQQFSLDSEMVNLLCTQQQLPSQQLQPMHQPDETMSWLPTLQQQNSMMFRTENNLLQSEGRSVHDHNNRKLFIGKTRTSEERQHHHHDQPQNTSQSNQNFASIIPKTSTKKNRTSQLTNLTQQSSLYFPPCGASDQQSMVMSDCHNCVLEQKKRSITQNAFQDAIKMTQYLMKEIERLQRTNKETAGLVVNEHQMAQMLTNKYQGQQSNQSYQPFPEDDDTDEEINAIDSQDLPEHPAHRRC